MCLSPLVSVSGPANWSSVAAPVVVSGSSSDDTGVSSVVLEIFDRDTSEWWDGSSWQVARSSFDAVLDAPGEASSGWSYSFDPPSVSSQPYWVTVRRLMRRGTPVRMRIRTSRLPPLIYPRCRISASNAMGRSAVMRIQSR